MHPGILLSLLLLASTPLPAASPGTAAAGRQSPPIEVFDHVDIGDPAAGEAGPAGGPGGGAAHTFQLEQVRLAGQRQLLDQSLSTMIDALRSDPADPLPIVAALRSQHAHWLAYREADCALAGTLTGAGGSWPGVHALTCTIDAMNRRGDDFSSATRCLHQLAPDASQFERLECLVDLVEWSMDAD